MYQKRNRNLYELVSDEQITKYANDAKTKYPHEQKIIILST